MRLDADLLASAVGCPLARAQTFAPHLAEACAAFGIDTPNRLGGFLGQVSVESGALRYVEELADGKSYEGRVDLGNTQPGDGPRFKGHGLIQCTGRNNHAAARDRLLAKLGDRVPDFEADPAAMTSPEWASWSAAEWWDRNHANTWADAGDWRALGRLVNRGDARAAKPANGEAERLAATAHALRALDVRAAVDDGQAEPPAAPAAPSLPAGEAPDWQPPPQEPAPMLAPFIAAALPSIVDAIPKLAKVFGSGSAVSERNIKAAELVAETVKAATGAATEQEAVQKLRTDPAAVHAATKAIDAIWFDLTEAGGGGIDGARKADQAAQTTGDIRKSPSFWIALALLPAVYLILGSVVGLFGKAWPDEVRAAVANGALGMILGGVVGYYFGQSTTRNRTTPPGA